MTDFVIPASGIRGPRIVYGTAWKKADTERLVAAAIQLGFRGVDTACQPKHYNEAGAGAGVLACLNAGLTRGELFLQTKFTPLSGQDPKQIPYDPNAPLSEQVAQSFAASRRNLQTDYLDSLLLHSPMAHAGQTMKVWRAMESLVDGGGVRQLGISNCYSLDQLDSLYHSARVKPAVVQNRFYAESTYDHEVRAFCRERRISYQSFWTLTANSRVLAHDTITTLAATYGRTPAQILFRYLTQVDVVPLTGTRSEAHMREDLAIFEFQLTDREREAVDALF
ncbi:MAG TPA: aldo/keto reductase [Burkholderiaceae bacterium]|nr:aldo/keto reductase [Burkholderiaceae bacterium]